MGAADYLILALVALGACFAVRAYRKARKSGGGCSGNCASCGRSCRK